MGFKANRKSKSGYGQARPAWGITNTIRSIDSFGSEIPQFNLRGETKVNTVYGGVVTTIIFTLALIYSSMKAIELAGRKNPSISRAIEERDYSSEVDKISFKDINLRFAFGVVDSVSGEDKLDSRYNKFLVRLEGAKDGVPNEKILSYHECQEEDYAKFYPVGRTYA